MSRRGETFIRPLQTLALQTLSQPFVSLCSTLIVPKSYRIISFYSTLIVPKSYHFFLQHPDRSEVVFFGWWALSDTDHRAEQLAGPGR